MTKMNCRLNQLVGINTTKLGDDEDAKDHLFELFSRAADAEKMSRHCMGFFNDAGLCLVGDDGATSVAFVMLTKMTANQQLDWERFHTEIIVKIFENRNETN